MIHISVLEQVLELKRGENGFFVVKTVQIWQGYIQSLEIVPYFSIVDVCNETVKKQKFLRIL